MLDRRFYWGTIRKAIVAFGNMFNNLTIQRKDENGEVVHPSSSDWKWGE